MASLPNKADITSFLESCNVPLQEWGKGKAKTVDHLVKEIVNREASLSVTGDQVVREVYGAGVLVYFTQESKRQRLVELKQVFKDGRERTRSLEVSVSEKLTPGEDPKLGAIRALHEELGINVPVPLVEAETLEKGPVASDSYPGLFSLYHLYRYTLELPTELYRADGYKEVQEDKTNYYGWVEER